MSDPTPNVALLRQVRDHIAAHPEQWNQEFWRSGGRCETAYCFAGWTAELAGGTWMLDNPGASPVRSPYLTVDPADLKSDVMRDALGKRAVHASRRATRLLGLTGEEADNLFAPGNSTLDRLDAALAPIFARAGEPS